jgi:hypothetical protein
VSSFAPFSSVLLQGSFNDAAFFGFINVDHFYELGFELIVIEILVNRDHDSTCQVVW